MAATDVLTIEAETFGRKINFAELWRYRELLYYFTWRDITVRYKQTLLGAGWAILYPVLSTGVFSIFFGAVAKMPSDGVPYTLFTFSSLLLWIFFSSTMGRCSSSLVGNAHLIQKVYFPRLLLPAAAVFPGVVDFVIASSVLLIGMLVQGRWPSPAMAPLLLLTWLGVGVLALGFGMFLGALNVRFRDVNNAIAFVLQMWMFATPVVYPLSLVDPRYHWLIGINPMVGYVETFRAALFGLSVPWALLSWSFLASVIAVYVGVRYFSRVERTFADVV